MTAVNTEKARKVLKEAFPFTEKCTQYIAVYRTKSNKELALERDRTEAYFLWLQKYDAVIPGVAVKNAKSPGQPYEAKQTRNSNLNETNAPMLKAGKRAWYVEVEDLKALEALVVWYKSL